MRRIAHSTRQVQSRGGGSPRQRRQRLVRVDGKERARLKAQLRLTRIDWQRWQAGQAARHGPAACRSCGAQPCGHTWRVDTRWGDSGGDSRGDSRGEVEPDESRYCCERCTHRSPPGWRASHVVWADAYGEPVMELEMRAGDRIYMRADGVVQWVALATDVGNEGEPPARAPLLLGQAEPMAVLLARGSSDSETPGGEWGGPRVVGALASRQSARTGGSTSTLAVALPEPATCEVGEARMLDGQIGTPPPAVGANDTRRKRKHG